MARLVEEGAVFFAFFFLFFLFLKEGERVGGGEADDEEG